MAKQQPGGVLHTRDGALFVQLEPNSQPRYVGCVDVDSIDEPGGGIDTLIRCFRTDGQGWDTVSSTRTAPDPVSTTITELVRKGQSMLEQIKACPASFWFHQRDCGYADQFTNYVRTAMLPVAFVGDRGRENLVMREEDVQSQRTYALSAFPPVYDIFKLASTRVSIAAPTDITDIAFVDAVRCAGSCGPAQGPCKTGFAVSGPAAGSPASTAAVWHTNDYAQTWTQTAGDPFAGAEDIASVVVVPVDANTNRVIVARGTTDGGNPAEIAYSDDNGATWTNVNVGSVNGQFAIGPNSLFALDFYNIWLATDDGFIYKSSDGGVTWATQEAGVITASGIFAIHFADESIGYAAGSNDEILRTIDGGFSWSATTSVTGSGGDVLAIQALDSQRAWLGNDDGELWYTIDGGTTWTERSFSGGGVGSVNDLVFLTDMIGFMLHDTAAPVGRLFRTIDGGFTWELVQLATNAGGAALAVCDENNVYGVGPVQGGTGFLFKALPAA